MNSDTSQLGSDASFKGAMYKTLRPSADRCRIMIVDDHPIVREGMKQFINAQPDLYISCEASNIAEALALMAMCKPELVICDISLKNESGLDLIKSLRRDQPRLGLLVMSQHDEATFAEQALRAGANGYLMKQEATSNILKAIRLVMAGDVYLSNAMTTRLATGLVSSESGASNLLDNLSDRELEVLHLLGMGLGTRQIADKLNRSIKTVEAHRANLKSKLNLSSGTDLVHFAFKLSTQKAL